MDPPLKYSRSYKRLSSSPSSSTIIGFSHGTIFLFLYTLCVVLGASVCFYFQFVCVQFYGLCNNLDPCILVWERDTLRLFIIHSCSSLICVECLAFVIYAFSSCFQASLVQRAFSFCSQEVLLLLLHPFCFVSNKLIGVWLSGNYHIGSVKSAA